LVEYEAAHIQLTDEILFGNLYVSEHKTAGPASPAAKEAVQVFGLDSRSLVYDERADATV
jgi:hypothetical protein